MVIFMGNLGLSWNKPNISISNLPDIAKPPEVTTCDDLNFTMNQEQQRNTSISKLSNNDFMILHQNIRSPNDNKIDEFSVSLATNPPHGVCLAEHNLRDNELDCIAIKNYKLGAKFCRNSFKNGGVCIFLQDNLQFTDVSLFKFCREKAWKFVL
jgi:hypothetical protein